MAIPSCALDRAAINYLGSKSPWRELGMGVRTQNVTVMARLRSIRVRVRVRVTLGTRLAASLAGISQDILGRIFRTWDSGTLCWLISQYILGNPRISRTWNSETQCWLLGWLGEVSDRCIVVTIPSPSIVHRLQKLVDMLLPSIALTSDALRVPSSKNAKCAATLYST